MKSNNLYVLAAPHSKNSYWWANIKRGLIKNSFEYKYNLVYLTSDDLKMPSRISGEMVLIVGHNPAWINESIEALFALKATPLLANTSMFQGHRKTCSGIVLGLEDAILDTIEYLKSCGRERIVFLGANPDSISDKIKSDVFPNKNDIVFAPEGIEKCVDAFVEKLQDLKYNSALCANDTVAICLMKKMTEKGYKMPDDFFVIGMGNSFIGQGMTPPLSSIDFNYYEMGKQAVNLYHNIKTSSPEYNMVLTLECKLIVRDSARMPNYDVRSDSRREKNAISSSESKYFDGETVGGILSTEAFLQSCDYTDAKILVGLMNNKPIKAISEETFLGERAVRYRIENLIKQKGFGNRSELTEFLKSSINNKKEGIKRND